MFKKYRHMNKLDQIYRSQSVNRKKKEESFWKSINWLKGIPDVEEIYDMWTVWRKFIRLNPFSSKKKIPSTSNGSYFIVLLILK